jgi:hypothetical protein
VTSSIQHHSVRTGPASGIFFQSSSLPNKKAELKVLISSARKIQATRLTACSGPVAFRPRLTTGLAFQIFDIYLIIINECPLKVKGAALSPIPKIK